MTFKALTLSSTALGLTLAGAAMADTNRANLEQLGDSNLAQIDQATATNSLVGSDVMAARQDGLANRLSVIQSGDGNVLGDAGPGLSQTGSYNEANVEQMGDLNSVASLTQISGPDGNTVVILQNSAVGAGLPGNMIGSVVQDATNGGPGVNFLTVEQNGANEIGSLSQTNGGSTATIVQIGEANMIESVSQVNSFNNLDLSVDGNANWVASVSQGHPAPNFGESNTATIAIQGSGNGSDLGASVPGVFTDAAALAGAGQASLWQNGGRNNATVTIIGDDNLFGASQSGEFNTIDQMSIMGNANQMAVTQLFANNRAWAEIAGGDGNNIGIRQDALNFGLSGNAADVIVAPGSNFNSVSVMQVGNGQTANAQVMGDENAVTVDQNGQTNAAYLNVETNRNTISVDQDSDMNVANVTVNGGDTNLLTAQQSGPSNTLDAYIHGSGTNEGGFFSAEAVDAAQQNGLMAGTITQSGSTNRMNMQIGQDGSVVMNTNFAVLQSGFNNEAAYTVTGGGFDNQYVLVQSGDNNFANTTQTGSLNVATILQ